MIAGLIRAPSALSPWSNYDGALDRRRVVLQRMREEGFITPAQEKAARDVRPRIRPFPGATEARHGYAKEFLRQQFRDQFGGDHFELVHRRSVANRIVNDGPLPRSKFEVEPHRFQRQEDIGKNNGSIQRKSIDRLECHLRGQLRCLAHLED